MVFNCSNGCSEHTHCISGFALCIISAMRYLCDCSVRRGFMLPSTQRESYTGTVTGLFVYLVVISFQHLSRPSHISVSFVDLFIRSLAVTASGYK